MGYFSNMTEWECWASSNCFKCQHWPKGEDDPGCPIEMAHMVYNYELCNEDSNPGKQILDMLIPPAKDGLGNRKCAMFIARSSASNKQAKDWEKYREVLREMRETETTAQRA